MDDFIFFVEGKAGKDWLCWVQIPHCKQSLEIAQGLAYGGLWQMFKEGAQQITVENVPAVTEGISAKTGLRVLIPGHKQLRGDNFLIRVAGLRNKYKQMVNDLLIAVQLPRFGEVSGLEVVEQMATIGLGYYCGNTIKGVTVKRAGETNPGALEDNKVILS